MRVYFKVTMLLILVASCLISTQAAIHTIDGINYNLILNSTSGNLAVVEPGNYSGVVTIPSTVQYEGSTYTVAYIGDSAFKNSKATSINLPNTIVSIGDDAFMFSRASSLVIPPSVRYIGSTAFASATFKPLNIQSRNIEIESNTFQYYLGDIITYSKHVYDIKKSGLETSIVKIYTYESCVSIETESYLKGIKIIPKIKQQPYDPGITITGYATPAGAKSKVVDGHTMYYGLEPNTSYTFQMNYTLNEEKYNYSFYPKTLSYTSFIEQKTQRTLSINPVKSASDVSTGKVKITKFLFDGVALEPNDTGLVYIDNLKPGQTYNTKTTLYYEDNKSKSYTYEAQVSTKDLLAALKLDGTITASSINMTYSFEEDCDAEILSSYYVSSISPDTCLSSKIYYNGLDPYSEYYFCIISDVKDCGRIETVFPIWTDTLNIQTEDARIVKAGDVVFVSHTNLDNKEQNVGFEWRRLDWDDSFNSNHVSCYMFDESMEGLVKNMNVNALWKYRPYYQSNSGEYYYGEWVSFDPSNTSFYEPIVHTYPDVVLNENNAIVNVYVMNGSDAIISRGLRFWKEGFENDYQVLTAKGVVMNFNLNSLDYATNYKFQAFAETEDDIYYGEIRSFRTNDNLTKVEEIISEKSRVVRIFDAQGRQTSKINKGLNILLYENGSTKKVIF